MGGAPDPAGYARRLGARWVVLGTLCILLAPIWVARASGADHLSPFAWLFILLGLWLIVQPFRLKRHAIAISYAITSDRVLIFNGSKLRSIPLALVATRKRRERPDGSGTLYLSDQRTPYADERNSPGKIRFIAVPQVRQVQAILDSARESHLAGGANPAPAY